MITVPRASRIVGFALLCIVVVGCVADDPLTFEVTTQEQTAPPAAPAPDAVPESESESESEAVFPPVNDDVMRPTTIVDLRGQETVTIEIRDNVFDERFFRVDPGTQIVFVDRGANTHDVTAAAEGAFPKIDKEALAAAPQALVLDVPGDYPFYCSIHGTSTRGQTGYVVVGGG